MKLSIQTDHKKGPSFEHKVIEAEITEVAIINKHLCYSYSRNILPVTRCRKK